MTTSDVIQGAWSALRAENYMQPGVCERRIFANSGHSVFAALERPADLRQIHFHFALPVDRIPRLELRGVVLKGDVLSAGRIRIRLELASPAFEEIFSALAADVVAKMLPAASDSQALELLVLRLMHWQKFMQAAGPQGLSAEEQAGLFGELMFLRTVLVATGGAPAMLASWQGPAARNQDFFHGGHAIEVKTTTTNVMDSVIISNEHQLDDDGLASLHLFHLCLEVRDGSGVSLPALVADIRGLLLSELEPQLADLLLEAGYLDSQVHLYASRGYVERRGTYYHVTSGFPRILGGALDPATSEVRYRLNLSGCAGFRRSEAQVLKDYAGAAS